MMKRIFTVLIYIIIFIFPSVVLAQPSFTGSVPDTSPIDQQTLLLASGGLIYAVHKIRESRKKKDSE